MTDDQTVHTTLHNRFIADAIVRLEAQAVASERLADLARGQGDLIERGETDAILGVLHQRQSLIDEMLGVVADIGPLADAVQRSPQDASDAQRATVRRLVDSIGQRLAQVIEIDARDRSRLERRLSEIDRERAVNGTARTAHNAYGRAREPANRATGLRNRFTDQQG